MTYSEEPVTRDAMTDSQFAEMMQIGLKQAKEGDTIACEDAFDQLLREEIDDVKAKLACGQQPVFDSVDALFDALEKDEWLIE